MLTGGGTDDWELIAKSHIEMYRKYTPINNDDCILEVGCGVGRDAIEISEILSTKGKYLGIDIIKPSIEWCKNNITKNNSNFKFQYFDINSDIHNSLGKLKTTDIKIPLEDSTVDRIFLHSVFTHMFEEDIVHYLKEFRRILKPDGLVLASFFVLDSTSLKEVRSGKGSKHRHPLSFNYHFNNDKQVYINDEKYPEGAVGYSPKKITQILNKSEMLINGGFIHRGNWSGIKGPINGQDILVLQKGTKLERFAQFSKPLKFTNR